MKHRHLGKAGFDVSELGYGAWGIGGGHWVGANEDRSLAALRFAIESGVTFIDTALAYGDGASEELVGRAVRDAGGSVRIATKVPPRNRIWPAQPGIGIEEVFPYDYIIQSTGQSLRNLALDCIDLQQLHVWNPAWLGRDEWRRAFETIKTSGMARAVGVSINDHQPDSAIELIETGLIDSVQVIYNIFDQSPERTLFDVCRKQNIGVIARVPFDEGSLAGRVDEDTVFPAGDFRNRYFRGGRRQEVAARTRAIAEDLELSGMETLPEVALRFCLSNNAVSSVIPGMRSVESVESNVVAASLGPLPQSTLDILRRHTWERNFYA